MSTIYLPFGQPALLTVLIDEFQSQDGYWNLGAKCVSNALGDNHRFVFSGDTLQGVATPLQDVECPISPVTGPAGTSRCDEILLRFANGKETFLHETREGILAALDEYIRSATLLQNHMVAAETYYFQDTP